MAIIKAIKAYQNKAFIALLCRNTFNVVNKSIPLDKIKRYAKTLRILYACSSVIKEV